MAEGWEALTPESKVAGRIFHPVLLPMTVRSRVKGYLGAGVHADPSAGDPGMMQRQGLPKKGDTPVPGCLRESFEASSCLLHLLWALPLPGEGGAPTPRGETQGWTELPSSPHPHPELPVPGAEGRGRAGSSRLDSAKLWGAS